MTEEFDPHRRLAMRYGLARRAAAYMQPSTTIVAAVILALTVIAVSIGIAQADTLGAMVDDEVGRLALFGAVIATVTLGGFTALLMRLTAPATQRPCDFTRL
jgi:hypothetical protein